MLAPHMRTQAHNVLSQPIFCLPLSIERDGDVFMLVQYSTAL